MLTVTQQEYDNKHPDFKSVWTTERTDWENWQQIRHLYMGKRTMLSNINGGTCLLVEGQDFEIVPDTTKKN